MGCIVLILRPTDPQTNWYPRSVGEARAVAQYNLATCHAIRGEFEKSLKQLKSTIAEADSPVHAQMTSLHIYLELMEGLEIFLFSCKLRLLMETMKPLHFPEGHLL